MLHRREATYLNGQGIIRSKAQEPIGEGFKTKNKVMWKRRGGSECFCDAVCGIEWCKWCGIVVKRRNAK